MITLTEHCAKNQLDYYKERDAAIRGERPNIFQHDGRWYANDGENDQMRIEQPDPFEGFMPLDAVRRCGSAEGDAYAMLQKGHGNDKNYVVLSLDPHLSERIVERFGAKVRVLLRGDGALLLSEADGSGTSTRKLSLKKAGRRGSMSLGRNVGALARISELGRKFYYDADEMYAGGKAVLFVPRSGDAS